jgi:hypothetical protein
LAYQNHRVADVIRAKTVIEECYDSQGRSGPDTQAKNAFIGVINPIKDSCAEAPTTMPRRMAKASRERVDRYTRGLFSCLHPAATVGDSRHHTAIVEGEDQRCILVAGSLIRGSLRMQAALPRQTLEVGGGIGSLSDDQRSGSNGSHGQPDYGISQPSRAAAKGKS